MEVWRATLAAGDTDKAWSLFIQRYQPLIIAVIRRSIPDDDDVDDVLAEVCADLCHDALALPARHTDSGKAKFSTWLVAVVHHRTIDWLRRRDGRRRVAAPEGLSEFQQKIFDSIVSRRQTYVEAYEHINAHLRQKISFGGFMKEVLATFKSLEQATGKSVARYFPGPPDEIVQAERHAHEATVLAETATAIESALTVLPSDERLAVQLFVVDELPAAYVAQIVGWPNTRAVYNRVQRALAVLRREVERRGIEAPE